MGRVIGIATLKYSKGDGLGFAIPIGWLQSPALPLAANSRAKAQSGPAPASPGLSDSIFRLQQRPRSPTDFCSSLKTALASAPANFSNIAGAPDDMMPDWRNAELTLPFTTDCTVDTDKRNISYFCVWKKEQGAAVNARYKYTVQETDQCLVGFQKTVGDRITTWSKPTGGTVVVDSRHVMPNTTTWALMLTVKP
jgi:hypothetical protein